MEWIPRSENEQADYLSRLWDSDDWGLSATSFQLVEDVWDPPSIDRFASYLNAKLSRFNSKYLNPGSEAIDAFFIDWAGENNYVCPPVSLVPRVLLHMFNCKTCGTLIVPMWYSAPIWPMIYTRGVLLIPSSLIG